MFKTSAKRNRSNKSSGGETASAEDVNVQKKELRMPPDREKCKKP